MRKNREQVIIYGLTNVSDQVFLARNAKVRKAVLKNDPSMTLLSPPSRKELGRESRDL